MRAAAILCAVLLAGCAAHASAPRNRGDAAELARALDGYVAGEARRCIQPSRLNGPQIIGQTLLYNEGTRLWRNDVVDGCPSLVGDPIIVSEIYGGQLCANDRFRTLIRNSAVIPGPYCRFGSFTPYTKVKRSR